MTILQELVQILEKVSKSAAAAVYHRDYEKTKNKKYRKYNPNKRKRRPSSKGDVLNEYSPAIETRLREKRLQSLDSQLRSGECVNITNVTFQRSVKVHGQFTLGELEQLGYLKRERRVNPAGRSKQERWLYIGPEGSCINIQTPVVSYVGGAPSEKMSGQRLSPGEATEWSEVDYS